MPANNNATLEVDLGAIRSNYRLLKHRHGKQSVAAVVKADAYGLGMKAVSDALWQEGCRAFFVATLGEGLSLRKQLPDARIGVFNGLLKGQEKKFIASRLAPVLNDIGQVERWARKATPSCPAMLHVDTGMTRLGLDQAELEQLAARFPAIATSLACVISHLACANEPQHPKNTEQLARFHSALALLPGIKASLCNSSGLFLPPDFHFDMARPGCALYGINPVTGRNPMQQVATLSAPLLHIRTLDRPEAIGYGATAHAPAGSRIAIAALGYADGWMRQLGNRAYAYIGEHKVPVLGRISMDMTALDVTPVPQKLLASARAEFINRVQTVDDIAQACGTIGYEIFTRIGPRVERKYSA
jgi:alanine racemase